MRIPENCFLVFIVLLFAPSSFPSEIHPSCEIAKDSIVRLSESGLAQVSNLDSVRITCRVPARPFPSKPGESRPALTVATSAYEISPSRDKKLVPSEVHLVGGGGDGFGPDPPPEWVEFDVLIPLNSEELDAEARRYLTKLEQSMTPEQKEQLKEQFIEDGKKKMLERLRPLVYQQRVGHFQVECRVLDGSRVMGTDVVEIEVVFKGRFSDVGLPGVAPA